MAKNQPVNNAENDPDTQGAGARSVARHQWPGVLADWDRWPLRS